MTDHRETDDLGMVEYEIPHLLLQANMTFNYGLALEQYEAFAISIDENYTYTFVKAIVHSEYLQSIRSGRPACGTLKVLRSKPFNIVGRNTRRDFLKSLMALGRYFFVLSFSFPCENTALWVERNMSTKAQHTLDTV